MVKTPENSQETKSLVSDTNKMFVKQKETLFDNLVQMVSVSKQIALKYEIDKKRHIEKQNWTRYGLVYSDVHENEYRVCFRNLDEICFRNRKIEHSMANFSE